VTLVHGNQTLNTVYVHHDRPDTFLEKMGMSLGTRAGDIVCFGHTHVPWHRVLNGIHYVNTGSVGRPKDGDWRASYVLLELTASNVTAEIRRVAYDVEAAAQAILRSELPDEFADHLRQGGATRTATAETQGASITSGGRTLT
jgi:hypothetical protein